MASPAGIGIEIRLVRLRRSAKGVQLQGIGSVPTPGGAITGGMVVEPRVLADGLRRALRAYEIKGSWAVVGIPGRAVASRVLELPVMSREELTAVVAGEMEHYRMIPMNQGTFDFLPLRESTPENRRQPILVMAVEKRVADGYREALRLAGLQMAALELLPLAASRAVFPALEHGGCALITLGARGGELAVFVNGALRYLRQFDVGARDLAADGGQAEGSQERAPAASAPRALDGDQQEGHSLPSLDRRGSVGLQALIYEVERSLGFYHREAPASEHVERVMLSVDAERAPGLDRALETSLGIPVRLCEPFQGLLYSERRINPELIARVGAAYAPAVGLALRMVEETPRAPRMDLSITGRESRMARVAPRWLTWALAASLAVVLGALIGTLEAGRVVERRQAELAEAREELARVSQQEQERTRAARRAREAQHIVQLRGVPWSDILFEVSAALPVQAWLSSLGMEAGNTLSLQGTALSAGSVARLMESFTRSRLFRAPQMSSVTQESARGRGFVKYEVKVQVSPPKQAAALPPAAAGTEAAR